MSEMVERVGIAIDDLLTEGWNGSIDVSDFHKRLARAAIEAMRQPTQDMLDDVTAADQHEPFSDATMRSVYSAMIDAALR